MPLELAWPATLPGRDVVPNVPDVFGGVGVRAVEADAAHGQRVSPVTLRSRVAKKSNGTLRTASLPARRDVVLDSVAPGE